MRIIFQCNNGCCMFFRCVYSDINHAMCSPLVLIIIIFGRSLFNSSIITILLMAVVYGRFWLIIRGIVLSTRFPIMIWYFFTKTIFLGITVFWPMGDTWLLIGVLVPIILTESSSEDYFCHVHQYFGEGLMRFSVHFYCCCCSCTSLNIIFLTIDWEKYIIST